MKQPFRGLLLLLLPISLLFTTCGEDEEPTLSNEKMITRFEVAGVVADISQTTRTIFAVVPEAAGLTALIPSITLSANATIDPAAGVAQDFTNDVIYTVTAQDQSTTTYRVNITLDVYTFTHAGKTYQVIKTPLSWTEAAEAAVARGGYLAEINDFDEQTAIFNALNGPANIDPLQFLRPAVWLGGNDLAEEGSWIWDGDNDGNGIPFWNGGVDGMAIDNRYTRWGQEPDNAGNQDGLAMMIGATVINEPSQWNDLNIGENYFFVVEYD
ncbi:MAG: DUF5018 domain-containing protein [Bacteroidota bacterium]